MKENNLTHARTCVYNVNYHIVWSVKYRHPVLKGGIDDYLKVVLKEIADDKDFIIQSKIMLTMAYICFCSSKFRLHILLKC